MLWTMLHTSLVCCARASLFTTFCPLLDQLELGPVQADGMPSYIVLTLRDWKGNADDRLTHVRIIAMNLHSPCVAFILL